MKLPAISACPPSRSSIRSGTSTSIAPNISDGTATKAVAIITGRVTIAAATSASVWRSGGGDSGVRQTSTPNPAEIARTAPKTASVPTSAARAPRAGPIRAPATAVPSAVPITEPRRSGGAVVISQVSAPDQISAPATPWQKRAASSSAISLPKPKATLESPSSARPASTVRRGPARLASNPAGSEASRVPAA